MKPTPDIDHHLIMIYEMLDTINSRQTRIENKLDEMLIVKQYVREMNNTIRLFINHVVESQEDSPPNR